MTNYYVYVHRVADRGVFYVGKGCNRRAFTSHQRSKWWRAVVNKNGGIFDVEIVRDGFVDAKEAYALEKKIIAELRASGAKLCNQTDGGEGALNPTPERREQMRQRMLGNQFTKGRAQSEVERNMRSIKNKGKKKPEGFSELIRKANLGAKRPKWARERMSEAAKARGQNNDLMGNGVANFAADKKMYVFRNVKTGETRTCHRADMAWVGPNFKSLFKTEKPLKTYFGWEVLSCHG